MIIEDWKKVLKHAWSVRLAILSGTFSAAEGVLPLFTDSVPRGAFACLSVVCGVGAAVSRFIVQKALHGDD